MGKVETAKTEGASDEAPCAEEKAEGEEERCVEATLAKEALRVTEEVTKLLIKRKTRPERDMKKRAKRKYLKLLQVGSGPYESTMSLATQISVLVGDSAFAQENILSPYNDAWWSRKSSHALCIERIKRIIEEASAMEMVEQESVEMPPVVEEAGGDEIEDGKSNAGDGEQGHGGNRNVEEGDSQKKAAQKKTMNQINN